MDLLYDTNTQDLVLTSEGDLATTANPSVQNGYVFLQGQAFNLNQPSTGIGFSSGIYGSDTTKMAYELNRWVQQVEQDGGSANWTTTNGGAPFNWQVNYLGQLVSSGSTGSTNPSGTPALTSYPVQPGQTIRDVVLNATGNIANLDDILTANNFDDWNPTLTAGQVITIPATVMIDANQLNLLTAYPVCNNAPVDYLTLIDDLFNVLSGNWILSTGFWNPDAVWTPTGLWNP